MGLKDSFHVLAFPAPVDYQTLQSASIPLLLQCHLNRSGALAAPLLAKQQQ